jgi:hypothetical protein
MRPIVESLFSELTLLGFIGLTLFLVFKMAWLKELSEKLYGEENEITELGEAVHMVLFLIMVIFLAQAVLMAQMGEHILSTWKTWEQRKIESFSPKAIVDAKSLSHAEQEKSDSTSLQRECSARARFGNSAHASRALREMIARPKISRNERKTTETGAFEVGNFAPLSCPGRTRRSSNSSSSRGCRSTRASCSTRSAGTASSWPTG